MKDSVLLLSYQNDMAVIRTVDNTIKDRSCSCKAIRKAEEMYYQSDKVLDKGSRSCTPSSSFCWASSDAIGSCLFFCSPSFQSQAFKRVTLDINFSATLGSSFYTVSICFHPRASHFHLLFPNLHHSSYEGMSRYEANLRSGLEVWLLAIACYFEIPNITRIHFSCWHQGDSVLYALLPGREGPMLLGTFAMLLLVLEEAPGLEGDSDGTYRD